MGTALLGMQSASISFGLRGPFAQVLWISQLLLKRNTLNSSKGHEDSFLGGVSVLFLNLGSGHTGMFVL